MRLRDLTFRWRLLLLGTSAVFVLLAAWYLISLPPSLAALLLLNRVESYRAIIGVGVAGILLMAFLCAAEFQPVQGDADSDGRTSRIIRESRRRIRTGAIVCAAVAFMMYFWAGRSFITNYPQLRLTLWEVGLVSAGAALVVLLTSARKVVAGGVAFVLFGAVMSAPVNPLYSGLGPLTSSPLLITLAQTASRIRDPGHSVWLSYEGPAVNDVLLASGLQTLNAVALYPDEHAWEILDPQRRAVDVWNRYADPFFVPGSSMVPTLGLANADAIEVVINPCSPAAGKLGVGFVVSPVPLTFRCLALHSYSIYPKGSVSPRTPVYIYYRKAASAT
jgi:hypothetical protein